MHSLNFGDRLIIFMVSTVLALPLASIGNATKPAAQVAWYSPSQSAVVHVNATDMLAFRSSAEADELSPDELSPDELSPDELSPDRLSPDDCKQHQSAHGAVSAC